MIPRLEKRKEEPGCALLATAAHRCPCARSLRPAAGFHHATGARAAGGGPRSAALRLQSAARFTRSLGQTLRILAWAWFAQGSLRTGWAARLARTSWDTRAIWKVCQQARVVARGWSVRDARTTWDTRASRKVGQLPRDVACGRTDRPARVARTSWDARAIRQVCQQARDVWGRQRQSWRKCQPLIHRLDCDAGESLPACGRPQPASQANQVHGIVSPCAVTAAARQATARARELMLIMLATANEPKHRAVPARVGIRGAENSCGSPGRSVPLFTAI
jgi:hypothetical protein